MHTLFRRSWGTLLASTKMRGYHESRRLRNVSRFAHCFPDCLPKISIIVGHIQKTPSLAGVLHTGLGCNEIVDMMRTVNALHFHMLLCSMFLPDSLLPRPLHLIVGDISLLKEVSSNNGD